MPRLFLQIRPFDDNVKRLFLCAAELATIPAFKGRLKCFRHQTESLQIIGEHLIRFHPVVSRLRNREKHARKIRELTSDLLKAGVADRSGEGSHRNFIHPCVDRPVTISGKPGADAKVYQEHAVQLAIEEATRHE